MSRRVDIEIVWGDRPATSPVGPDAPPIVRVERTDPARPFYAAGWARRSRSAPKPTIRIVGPERERKEREAWADYLALGYVVGRAVLDGEPLDVAMQGALRALPVAHRVRVERLSPSLTTSNADEIRELGREMFEGESE